MEPKLVQPASIAQLRNDGPLPDAIFHTLPCAIAILDGQRRFVRVNAALADLHGVPLAAHAGNSWTVIAPALAAQIGPLLDRVLIAGLVTVEGYLRLGEGAGESSWRVTAHRMPSAESEHGAAFVIIDEPHAAPGQAMQLPEARIRRQLDHLAAFVAVLAPDGRVVDVNQTPLDSAGIALADVLGRRFWDCYWWNYDPALQVELRAAVTRAARGEMIRYDTTSRAAGGHLVALDFMLAPMREDDGRITALIASAIDISARKAGEEALRFSEERFRLVVESVPEGLVMMDARGYMVLVNRGMERLFGYRREEMLGRHVNLLLDERSRERCAALVAECLAPADAADPNDRTELYALGADGRDFEIEIGMTLMPHRRSAHVLATVVDVTQRKADESLLKHALAEKTVLLNEVHHRVKNNLQVISSLLNLQTRTAPPEAQEVLADSQNRVKAMALIHQLLFERADMARIDLGLYLERLTGLLRDSVASDRRNVELRFEQTGASLAFDLHAAVPCGLLVNELVTNAVKHAFPGGRAGTVTIRLEHPAGRAGTLTIADDGVGLPPDVEPGRKQSLGLQLVPLLVDQLGGDFVLDRSAGTRFVVNFKPRMEVAR
ncbi:MAG: PAS domain S-box protein [Gammaproteobacteria bacterium]|nr:PAS domain S-box protein [Gammaproteobacteria bacterium]MBI5618172.1 PAS domain S-box protein [Gammaproteobacteria bacterium]